jgi:hypothetical protein
LRLVEELARTQADLRYRVDVAERHDQRWDDFVRCLELDGYRIEEGKLVAVDPTIKDDPPIEDDFSAELAKSGLPGAEGIRQMLDRSAGFFRQQPPNYNACLTDARIAVENLAKEIAKKRKPNYPGSFDETKWGSVLAYLNTSGLITKKEEEGLSGVYSFVSPGAHTVVGTDEEEMAYLGRRLVVSMGYFLVKRYNRKTP